MNCNTSKIYGLYVHRYIIKKTYTYSIFNGEIVIF